MKIAVANKIQYFIAAVMLAGCSTERASQAVIEDYFEAIEAGEVESAAALFADDATYIDNTFDFHIEGKAAIREMLNLSHAGIRPSDLERRRLIIDEGDVVMEWRLTGEHVGAVLGYAPTGATLEIETVSLFRIDGGEIVSITDYIDRVGLETQLQRNAAN